MKMIPLLSALALGSLFVAGCQDDRALGTERAAPERAAPGPNDYPPVNRPFDTSRPDPRTQTTPNDTATQQPSATDAARASKQGATSGVDPSATVINAEDLSSVPELREPLWGTANDTGATRRQDRTYNGVNIDAREPTGSRSQGPTSNGVPVMNDDSTTQSPRTRDENRNLVPGSNDMDDNRTNGTLRQEPVQTAPR